MSLVGPFDPSSASWSYSNSSTGVNAKRNPQTQNMENLAAQMRYSAASSCLRACVWLASGCALALARLQTLEAGSAIQVILLAELLLVNHLHCHQEKRVQTGHIFPLNVSSNQAASSPETMSSESGQASLP